MREEKRIPVRPSAPSIYVHQRKLFFLIESERRGEINTRQRRHGEFYSFFKQRRDIERTSFAFFAFFIFSFHLGVRVCGNRAVVSWAKERDKKKLCGRA